MRIYDLFVRALSEPEERRLSFLKQECNGNEQLYAEVKALLDTENKTLSETEFTQWFQPHHSPSDDKYLGLTGQRAGSFVLKNILGMGGMGAVYLADRDDGNFNQTVAVKVINPALENVLGRAALLREAHFMAKLDHSNIGKVYDAGVIDDAYPYIVMEYIEGSDVGELWRNNNSSLKHKLSAFQSLCDAIHYAHQLQIVHADLKPSNILVNASGHIKVVDFGIARFLDHDDNSDIPQLSRYVRALSSHYSSPELLAGSLPTTQSDIFSLGQILADLLSSITPPRFAAELNAIVAKATATEPSGRYATVMELKQDIQRFINGHVVEAYNAKWWFRLTKLCFRRPVGVGLTLLLLVGSTDVGINLYRQHQDVVEAKKHSDFLLSTFTKALRATDKRKSDEPFSAKDLLENTLQSLKSNAELPPDAIAELKIPLSKSFLSLGDIERSRSLLQEVIDSYPELTNKDLAFRAGAVMAGSLGHMEELEQLESRVGKLVEKLTFIDDTVVPGTYPQANFYRRYINQKKTYLYRGKPSELGAKHIQLIEGMKAHYWQQITPEQRADLYALLAQVYFQQLPKPGSYVFEYADENSLQNVYPKSIKASLANMEKATAEYKRLGLTNEVALTTFRSALLLMPLGKIELGKSRVAESMEMFERLLGKGNILMYSHYTNAAFYAKVFDQQLALEYVVKALSVVKRQEPNPQRLINAYGFYLDLLRNNGQFTLFREMAEEELRLFMTVPDDEMRTGSIHSVMVLLNQYAGDFYTLPANANTVLSRASAFESLINEYVAHSPYNNFNLSPAGIKALQDFITDRDHRKLLRTRMANPSGNSLAIKRSMSIDTQKLCWLNSIYDSEYDKRCDASVLEGSWNSIEQKYDGERFTGLVFESMQKLENRQFDASAKALSAAQTMFDLGNYSKQGLWPTLMAIVRASLPGGNHTELAPLMKTLEQEYGADSPYTKFARRHQAPPLGD